MEITQDKIDLISKIIKNDRKYSNNEDLYDDFFNETCKRSGAIFDTIDNPAVLETYLRRVVTTAIINVLKDSGRLRRSRSGYIPVKEVPLDTVAEVMDSSVVTVVPTPLPEEEDIKVCQPENIEQNIINDEFSQFEESFDLNNFDNGNEISGEQKQEEEKEEVIEENIQTSQDAIDDEITQIDELSQIENEQEIISEPEIMPEPETILQPEDILELEDEINFDDEIPQNIENTEDINQNVGDSYSSYNISYASIDIPRTPEDVAIQKEALKFIADTIKKIDEENTSKEYMRIFMLRYDKGMTQKEIAQELGISQPEVSKRLFALINKLKELIEN